MSRKTMSEHISELVRAGHPVGKAVAMATQKYADGGDVKDDVPEIDPKKAKQFEKGMNEPVWQPERWLQNLKSGLGLADNGGGQKYAGGGEVSPEDLSTLQDMFGSNSPALGQELDALGSSAAKDAVGQSTTPGMSLADYERLFDAEKGLVPSGPKQLPLPTGADAGFSLNGASYGAPNAAGVPAAAADSAAGLPSVSSNLPAVRAGGLPAAEAAATDGAIPTTGRVLGEEAGPTLLGAAGRVASKAALPATVAAELLRSTPAGEGEDAAVAALRQAEGKGTTTPHAGSIPLPNGGMDDKTLDAYIASHEAGGKDGPSLFDMVSSAYKNHDMTGPSAQDDLLAKLNAPGGRKLAGTAAKPADEALPAPVAATPAATMNPLLQKYLQDRADMQAAQQSANTNRLYAGMANAAGTLAASTYGATKPKDEAGFKALETNANAPVDAVQARQAAGLKSIQEQQTMLKATQEQSANDPNSALSASVRAAYGPILKKAGLDISSIGQMSAADIKDYAANPLDYSAKMKQVEAQQAATHEMAMARLQQAKDMHGIAVSDKQRVEDEKDATAIANKLNYLSASSRSALGSAANAKTSVARLIDIASRPDATNEDMQSVYGDLNRVVSNTTTMSGTEHQAYNNLQTKLAGYMSALTSNPTPAQIPEIKQHIIDVAKGMDKISDDVISHNTKMVQVGHEGWIQRHPSQWQAMVEAQAAGQAQAPGAAPGGGTVNVIDPNGHVRAIPQDKVQAAIAAGGRLAQ